MKQTGLIIVLFFWASSAFSVPFQPVGENVITGADMTGMRVTAFFEDGSSETNVWEATNTDDSIPEGEGFAGAAVGTGWLLVQEGYTLGNVSLIDGDFIGAWTLLNISAGLNMTALVIDALAGDIVFDILQSLTDPIDEDSPGSGQGRPLQEFPGSPPLTATYTEPYSGDDLFGTLTITFGGEGLASGTIMQFWADTDSIPVPEPATIILLLLGVGVLGIPFSIQTIQRIKRKNAWFTSMHA